MALLGVACVLAPAAASAGGFSNPDFGIRRLGMFAVTARPDDGTALFHNPAGLTLEQGTRFYHAQSWFFPNLGIRLYDSEGYLHPEHEIQPTLNVGAIPFLGGSFDLGSPRLRLAVGVYAPNAYGAMLPDDEATRYYVTEALFVAARATAAVGWAVTEKMSLGGSLSLIPVYLTATRKINALVLAEPDRRFDPVSATEDFDSTLELDGRDLTLAADLGVILRPLPTLRLGAAFASGSPVTLEGDVRLTNPDGSEVRTRHRTRMSLPFTLRAGFKWEFAPDFQLGADIYYWHYQVFQEQRTELDEPILGMAELVDPKNYGNCWAWNAGLLYRLHPRLELLASYQQDFTPIPERTFTLDNPTRDQSGVSLVARWQVNERWRIGVACVRNWFELADVQTSLANPPANMKGHGGNTEFGFDLSWAPWAEGVATEADR